MVFNEDHEQTEAPVFFTFRMLQTHKTVSFLGINSGALRNEYIKESIKRFGRRFDHEEPSGQSWFSTSFFGVADVVDR